MEIIKILEELYPTYDKFLNYNNNFELLIAVILSAQTTDNKVNQVTKVLFAKYPDPASLAKADYNDVINIIKILGLAKMKAQNIIKTAGIIHQNYGDIVPNNKDELIKLPGVGNKTANVVLALGYNEPTFPVDTHVKRLAIRLGYADNDDSIDLIEEKLMTKIPKEYWVLMHHRLILHGRNTCKAINPKCSDCKLKEYCRYYGENN